jgi:hypothetical protein
MGVEANKFLIVKPGVVLTPHIEPVILEMENDFKEANLVAYVTSGERTSGDQLRTIQKYAARYTRVQDEFPEIKTADVLKKIALPDGTKVFSWQRAWSRLLNIGVIINPPVPAACLYDYIRNGVNKKGQTIGHSPHYYGKAFDIGGGLDHDIKNELPVVQKALARGIKGMKGYLPERANNCIHVDVF